MSCHVPAADDMGTSRVVHNYAFPQHTSLDTTSQRHRTAKVAQMILLLLNNLHMKHPG